MSLKSELLNRLSYLLRRGQFDRELDEEIEFHIETRADELEAGGLVRAEALARARREFGSGARAKEETRAAWQFGWVEDLARDVRYCGRAFRRSPGFAAAAIVSLALGIGANTTVFSLVKAILLGGLPVRAPARLVSLHQPSGAARLSYPDYEDYRRQVTSFEDVAAAYPAVPRSLNAQDDAERLWGQLVTTNYFPVLGAEPPLGRGFTTEEFHSAVVVISDSIWKRRFGADRGIVGRTIRLGGQGYVVVGVAPPRFSGHIRGLVTDFWIPLGLHEQAVPQLQQGARGRLEQDRNQRWLYVTARLKEGLSPASAEAALQAVAGRLDEAYPRGREKRRLRLEAADALAMGLPQAKSLLSTLMVVVALVLLVACANVANLLLARAAARQQEFGIRLAIGAGRSRLVRQLLTESLFLSMAGALLGAVLAWLATNTLGRLQSSVPYPIALDLTLDGRVLLFTAALAIVTALVFGLAPALKGTRAGLSFALKGDGSGFAALRRFGLKNSLVVAQVALSLVLLVASGLFLRSLRNAASVPLGMDPKDVLLVSFDPRAAGYTNERAEVLFGRVLEGVRALPHVRSAGLVDTPPLSLAPNAVGVSQPGERAAVLADIYGVTSQYFGTLGIGLTRGRDFARSEPAGLPAAIVNEALAERVFPGVDPVGHTVNWEGMPHQVIGITRNAKSRTLAEKPRPQIFVSLEKEYSYFWGMAGVVLSVKSDGAATGLAEPVRGLLREMDPALPVYEVETMADHVDRALLLPRVCGALFGVFGGIALALAAVGLYGVMSYSVRQRTREIGIRLAIGARPGDVLRMLVRQGAWLVGVGLVIGLGLAYSVSRVATAFLYGVSARDGLTFAGVSVLLFGVAMAAVLLPARRAAGMDAVRSIRYE
ncbi:ABC transporter permease [Paludibaculum fermentans]|uniref:ABC transporter permease n=1 Tax=Paludibaculum fermentans TaxID=1473598 RepID=A0A7S7NM05_PALFE|nr:ABC transporter permease [Paludibaculum fermentans]QOY86112.1 ABC transporter permease [Paludibaculum fermentans]